VLNVIWTGYEWRSLLWWIWYGSVDQIWSDLTSRTSDEKCECMGYDTTWIWLLSQGTQQQFTVPHTSAQNGHIEHLHRTLMGKACAMCASCGVPPNWWDKFILTANYLSNCTRISSQLGRTPYEVWHSQKPDLSHLHEIGCHAFILVQNQWRHEGWLQCAQSISRCEINNSAGEAVCQVSLHLGHYAWDRHVRP
jgi:hypothetical protein